MRFKTAIGLMCEGKKIRRREWGPQEWIGLHGFNMRPDIPMADFVKDDWDLYDEGQSPIMLVEAWEQVISQPEFATILEKVAKRTKYGS